MNNTTKRTNFVYYEPNLDPNPHNGKHGDCSIRALACAMNITWKEAYDKLMFYAYKKYSVPDSEITIHDMLYNEGFSNQQEKYFGNGRTGKSEEYVGKHGNFYSIDDFLDEAEEDATYYVITNSHAVCIKNKLLYDNYDGCYSYKIEYIFKKEENKDEISTSN